MSIFLSQVRLRPVAATFAVFAVIAGSAVAAVAMPSSADGPVPIVTAQSTITAFAGYGAAGFSGDGGQATAARVAQPRDTDLGPDGSLYIADTYNHRIRRVSADGTITTVAGTGDSGYNGDGQQATQATIYWPHDILVDDVGVLYIADSANHRVRRVGLDGAISTIAGTGKSGFTSDGGPATQAKLKNPKGLALFEGKLYIADGGNNRVRVVDLASGIITTVAGTGDAGFGGDGGPATTAKLNYPQRIDVDSLGRIYVADARNHRVRVFTPGGTINTVAGSGASAYSGDGGQATQAALQFPRGVGVVGTEAIYIADSNNHRIRMVDLTTGIITTVAGTGKSGYGGDNGPAGAARLTNPRGVTVDAQGHLYVADSFNSAVRLITPDVVVPPGPNMVPVAAFSAVCSGARCAFDASASRDPDGSIREYVWDFGDGATGSGSIAAHTYGADGAFEVSLTVTDNRGESSSTSQTVSAADEGPAAVFEVLCEGLACTLDASGSADVDGSIVSFDWTLGDGDTAVGEVVTHDFADDGTYLVALTVTDDRGLTDVVGRDVVVANQAPVADFSIVCEGLACTLDASGSSDADGSIVSFGWTTGDGTSLSGAEASHEYLAEGTYTVTLTVTDDRAAVGAISKDVAIGLPSSAVAFVAADAVGGPASAMPGATIPVTAEVGDTLLLFVSSGSSRTPAVPGGWTLLGTEVDNELRTDVFWRLATDGDAGQRVTVPLLNSSGVPQSAPNTVTVSAYSGVGSPPVSVFTSGVEPSGSYVGAHTTPGVTVPTDGSWVVSYWADRTSNTSQQSATSNWTAPVGQQLRADAYNTANGGRVTSLLTDDGTATPAGPRQGLTATANGQTKKATLWTIVLQSE